MNFAQIFDLGVINLGAFDLGATFALAFFVLRGAMRGITGEIMSIIGLITSVFCAWVFALPLSVEALKYFPSWSPTVTKSACAAVIFMGLLATFGVISKIVIYLVRATKLSFLDHIFEQNIMGAVFGSLRTCVLVLFIYGVMSIFSPTMQSDWTKDSVAMKGASMVWPPIFKIMTDKGWIDPNQLTPYAIGALPDCQNAAPASNDTNPAQK